MQNKVVNKIDIFLHPISNTVKKVSSKLQIVLIIYQ